jgi:diaminohydroxyphosphoribosylaminopyrimidine deaminase/5-amino-6-(5-phosphoribosylamino)uracil reductase
VALSLAKRQLGQTWPNPSVGAVIIKDGQIIATGITAKGGRPHAETLALKDAGENARGAELYVTLEPCSHHGKTPPCTDAIINSGIKAVFVACRDPNPKVNGSGIESLKKAGIKVIENICSDEARELNRGFFSVIEKKRPYIALKIATSLDEKITNPESRWLTGEPARNYGHLLRAKYDAILTGAGTVMEDDPLLTCRLPGLKDHSPVRIVLDRSLRITENSKLIQTSDNIPLWIFSSFQRRLESMPSHLRHCQLFDMDPALRRDDKGEINHIASILAEKGVTRLLVEAGAKLSSAFLESGLVDRLYWFRAPIQVGEQGLALERPLSKLANFRQIENIKLGNDNLDILECSQGL